MTGTVTLLPNQWPKFFGIYFVWGQRARINAKTTGFINRSSLLGNVGIFV